MNIGYVTEPEKDYVKALDSAFTRDALVKAILPFRLVANDALLIAKSIKTQNDWQDFRAGLRRERRGEPNSEQWMERFAAILLPKIMLKVSMVAQQFCAPWGCAYIRLRDEGVIQEVKGIARWRGK